MRNELSVKIAFSVYIMPAEQFKSTLTKHVGVNF